MRFSRAVSFEDYQSLARRRLPKVLFDYIDGGAYAEVTIKRNATDFDKLCLRQRVMRDMSSVNLSLDLLNQPLAHPVLLGPVGFAGMFSRRGEVQAARAAAAAGVAFCLSTVSICSIEEVCAAVEKPPWFQLYMVKDRGFVRELLARAQAARYSWMAACARGSMCSRRWRSERKVAYWEKDGHLHWRRAAKEAFAACSARRGMS